MKTSILFILSLFIFIFAPGLCRAAEEEPHPEITLMDYNSNEISLDSNIPYSPKNTCGECHDYDVITNAYHFLAYLTGYVRKVVTALFRFQPVGQESEHAAL